MGETIDLVIQVLGCTGTGTEARELWFGVDCIIAESLCTGIWTLYGYRAVSTAGFVLEASSDSQKFRKPEDPASHVVPVKEVCAGLGGISMGAKQLGFQSLAMLDINSLATKSAALNGANMLQDDLTTSNAKRRLHAIAPDKVCLLLAGFPCQPFSRQGDGRGFADTRAQPFIHVLLLAWYLQPQGLVLECVTEAAQQEVPQAKRLFGKHILDARTLQLKERGPDTLSDVGVSNFLRALQPVLPMGHLVLLPRAVSLLSTAARSGQVEACKVQNLRQQGRYTS